MQKRFPLSVDGETYELLQKLADLLTDEKDVPVSIAQAIRIAAKEKVESLEVKR